MRYTIDDKPHTVRWDGDNLVIDDIPRDIDIISYHGGVLKFLLDNRYHEVIYGSRDIGVVNLEVDGVDMILSWRDTLDSVVYKHTGEGVTSSESAISSQIPGKVVSVSVVPGQDISEGDAICVLESMKMQVSVKSHTDGRIKSVRARVGASVAKGDVIADLE